MTLEAFIATHEVLRLDQAHRDPRFQDGALAYAIDPDENPDALLVHLYPYERVNHVIVESRRGFHCDWHEPCDTILPTLPEAVEYVWKNYGKRV